MFHSSSNIKHLFGVIVSTVEFKPLLLYLILMYELLMNGYHPLKPVIKLY